MVDDSVRNDITRYATEVRDGLNEFLEYTDSLIEVLAVENTSNGHRVLFVLESDDIELEDVSDEFDEEYVEEVFDAGSEFYFGQHGNRILFVESDAVDWTAVSAFKEHVGELIHCSLKAYDSTPDIETEE